MAKNLYELFDELKPQEKTTFVDARLDWASNGALCGEVTLRMCNPMSDN